MHRLRLSHPLSFVPFLGGRYRFADFPARGSSETLQKTAHGPATGRHAASYGQQARHISDMSDPDANWFALLGGQDGWLSSTTAFDQVALWRDGKYVKVPLRLETVRRTYTHRLELAPRAER
jgi:penicillin amidase